jgi:cell division GTPase FtsZ
MTIQEAESVVSDIGRHVHPQARIIWGASVVPSLQNAMQVMVVLTGVTPRESKPVIPGAKVATAAPAPRPVPAATKAAIGIDFLRH